jgi:hypothetical protein
LVLTVATEALTSCFEIFLRVVIYLFVPVALAYNRTLLLLTGNIKTLAYLWNDVTSVHQTARHVLTVTRITLKHHVGRLEDGVGQFGNGQLLVIGLLGGDDWRIGRQHEVDTRVWHQICLEFGDIDVQGTIESEGSRLKKKCFDLRFAITSAIYDSCDVQQRSTYQ